MLQGGVVDSSIKVVFAWTAVPGAGDVYQVYPVIGAAIGGVASLGDKRLGITLKTVGATKLRCIGHDYERGAIKLMAIGHALT